MALQPGLAEARRTIALVCAGLALVAVIGAIVYAAGPAGGGCGSGFAAARKPLPDPLLTPAEVEAIRVEKRNPFVARSEKARPIQACRRAGERRIIKGGIVASVILVPVLGMLGFLYWPRRDELTGFDLGVS